jgi:hypothetical protein
LPKGKEGVESGKDEARVNALAGKISVRFISLSAAILAAYRSNFTILSIDRPGPGRVMPTPLIDPQPLEIAVALPDRTSTGPAGSLVQDWTAGAMPVPA